MIRIIYRAVVRMHPLHFYRRYGSEMLWIFDEARTRRRELWLLLDALTSLARQRMFRPAIEAVPQAASDAPMFYVMAPAHTNRRALLAGGLLSWMTFLLIGYWAANGGGRMEISPLFGLEGSMERARIRAAVPAPPPANTEFAVYPGMRNPIAFPSTPVGVALQEWMQLYNDGRMSPMLRFYRSRFVQSATDPLSGELNSRLWMKWSANMGLLVPRVLDYSDRYEIAIRAIADDGSWWKLRMRVEHEPPHRIEHFTIIPVQ